MGQRAAGVDGRTDATAARLQSALKSFSGRTQGQ